MWSRKNIKCSKDKEFKMYGYKVKRLFLKRAATRLDNFLIFFLLQLERGMKWPLYCLNYSIKNEVYNSAGE